MAIDVTVDVLVAAIRVGSTAVERAEVERLRDYAIAEIAQHLGDAYADADPAILNEAAIRLVAFLYDVPSVARGLAFANALRQSGASRMLYRFLVHRAGLATPEAAMAQGVGTVGNPVVNVEVVGGELIVTYADGTVEQETLPAGVGQGVTQDALDAAIVAHAGMAEVHHSPPTVPTLPTNHLRRSDVAAGAGIAVTPTSGSDTAFTISASAGGGPAGLAGSWTWVVAFPPDQPGEMKFAATVSVGEIDTWAFNTGTGYDAARVQLLALAAGDQIEIQQSAARHQLVTVTGTPTLSADTVTVSGRANRGQGFEVPQHNTVVAISIIPGPIQGVDQTARDAAAEAQSTADGAVTSAATNAAAIAALPAGGGGSSGPTLIDTYSAPAGGTTVNVWVNTGVTVPETVKVFAIQWQDGNFGAGGLSDLDDWTMNLYDAARFRDGKTARTNTRPANQTRTYAIRFQANVLEFRGTAIPANSGLKIGVYSF